MDLTRLPALPPQPTSPAQPTRDVRAAQRAFFQAALGKVVEAGPTPAAPAPAAAAPEPAPAPVKAEPAAERFLRPGSIIDIKV